MAAAQPPLGELGWRGQFKHDSPEVVELRETLRTEAGVTGLEQVSPSEPDFAERAARIFRRDGYVVVTDTLTSGQLETVREALDATVRGMMEHDPNRLGNRGSHRYSMGGAPLAFGLDVPLSTMIDSEPVLEVITAIFQSDEYQCTGCKPTSNIGRCL